MPYIWHQQVRDKRLVGRPLSKKPQGEFEERHPESHSVLGKDG